MGEYFKILNTTKKQYIDPSQFGNNDEFSGLFEGVHAAALRYLLYGGSIEFENPLVGSWANDSIILAGDEAKPDLHGIKTSTPEYPNRNLNDIATGEYQDISLQVIELLCADDGFLARDLVLAALRDERLLTALTDISEKKDLPYLRGELRQLIWPNNTIELFDAYGIIKDDIKYQERVTWIIDRESIDAEAELRRDEIEALLTLTDNMIILKTYGSKNQAYKTVIANPLVDLKNVKLISYGLSLACVLYFSDGYGYFHVYDPVTLQEKTGITELIHQFILHKIKHKGNL